MSDDHHDIEQLKHLWSLDYEPLAMSPGKITPKGTMGDLTLARFVLQSKVALDSRSLVKATLLLAAATFATAFATVVLCVIEFLKKQ